MTDIVERLRDHADRLLLGGRNADTRVILEDAAQEIERLRTTLASWEAAAAMQRGSVGAPRGDSEPITITDAEPNTPR